MKILNASQVNTPISKIYNLGESNYKKEVLGKIPLRFSEAHKNGDIHIHDLEFYDLSYNCLNVDWVDDFLKKNNDEDALSIIFNLQPYFINLIQKLANDQAGGISFPNLDFSIAIILKKYTLNQNEEHCMYLMFKSLIKVLHENKTRQGQISYYTTFNVGLDVSFVGRIVTKSLIKAFHDSDIDVIRPNIVFKVNKKISLEQSSPNHDLLKLSVKTTLKKMIPTYLLTDSTCNKDYEPQQLSIVGCRTKLYKNKNGPKGAIGRFNVANTSINLPRIALKSNSIKTFYDNLNDILVLTKDQLIDRFNTLCKSIDLNLLQTCKEYSLFNKEIDYSTNKKFFNNGTLSIGYIGLYETIKVLINKETHNDDHALNLSLEIITHIKNFIDNINKTTNYNFSLISPAGERISGRFCSLDQKKYQHKIFEKKYYTNSFHIKVNSNISYIKKIQKEAPFHMISDGGCITYLELEKRYNDDLTIFIHRKKNTSNQLHFIKNIIDLLAYATNEGIHYIGFNFPLDICKKCKTKGSFDKCYNCNSNEIIHLRRVSGYIEDSNNFTCGKKYEEQNRTENF